MGSLALCYYFSTTVIASVTGIILVVLIHPGDPNQKTIKFDNTKHIDTIKTLDAMLDIIR
jgi:Na+/H+-dicarboxylate symporter